MRHFSVSLLLSLAWAATSACASTSAAVDRAVAVAMAQTHAKGVALALVDHGKVVLVRSYGIRNAAGAPLQPDTIIYGASLTKTVFAYAVMQLVDEKKIDLDRPIAALLPKPLPDYGNVDGSGHWGDLAVDERWRRITPRNVLTHSAGFANFSFLEPDRKLRIHYDPGTHYAYSGEGIMLLQFGVETGLGLDAGKLVQQRVFDRFNMGHTSAKWRPDFAANLADGWTEDGKPAPHDQRERVRLAGSMDTTITDMARFAAGLVRGEGLSAGARAEMVRPILPITTRSQFPTLLPDAPPAQRFSIAAGIGVVTFGGPQGPGFYKGGHDDQTANTMVCVERGKKCAIILSNDVRIERAFPDLVRALIGETGAPWRWEYSSLFP